MIKNTYKMLLLAILPTCVAVFTTSQASGQMEYLAEAMRPHYMTRDLVVFAEGLNLDDGQEAIVEAMFDTYEEEFEAGWGATQDRINRVAEENRDNPPSSSKETLEPVLNALGDWLEEKEALDNGLLDNVRAILINEQARLWPGFVQRLYREKSINRGRLSGESIDLFQIARDTSLQSIAENAIADHLAEYATALDIALHKRDAILRGNPKKLFDSILSGNTDRSTTRIDTLITARVEVREIHDRYIEIICSVLAAADSEEFRTRSLKRGYPRIYRRTPTQRIFRQAAENETYPPELVVLIVQLEGAYLQELDEINFKLLTLTRKHEPEVQRHRELAGQVRKQGGTPEKLDDPTRVMYKEREELGKRYIQMLRDLLSPEQFLELDGSRRWIPRDQQTPTGLPTKIDGPGGLSLSGRGVGKGSTGSKKGSPKSKDKPNPSGFDDSKGGSRTPND